MDEMHLCASISKGAKLGRATRPYAGNHSFTDSHKRSENGSRAAREAEKRRGGNPVKKKPWGEKKKSKYEHELSPNPRLASQLHTWEDYAACRKHALGSLKTPSPKISLNCCFYIRSRQFRLCQPNLSARTKIKTLQKVTEFSLYNITSQYPV